MVEVDFGINQTQWNLHPHVQQKPIKPLRHKTINCSYTYPNLLYLKFEEGMCNFICPRTCIKSQILGVPLVHNLM